MNSYTHDHISMMSLGDPEPVFLYKERCQHCGTKQHPDEMTLHEDSGLTLCEDCLGYFRQGDAEVLEYEIKKAADALATLGADKLDSLRFMAATTFESFDDKSNLDNIKFWAEVANRSLAQR